MPPVDDVDTLAESVREEIDAEEPEEDEEPAEHADEPDQDEPAEESADSEEEGPDDVEEPDESEDETPAPSRGSKRIETLAADRKRLREENERLHRELAQTRAPAQDPEAAKKARRQIIATQLADFELLTPEQRAERMENLIETGVRNMVQPLAGHIQDTTDRSAFKETYGPGTPTAKAYGKYAQEVERQVMDARSKGFTLNRETVFIALLGRAAAKGMGRPLDEARAGAKKRLSKAQGGSPSGRGDSGGRAKRSKVEELEDRLKDVPI